MSMTENSSFKDLIAFETNSFLNFDRGGCAFALKARDYKDPQCVCVIENHPADSRVKISEDNTFQTLSSSMGTGGVTYH